MCPLRLFPCSFPRRAHSRAAPPPLPPGLSDDRRLGDYTDAGTPEPGHGFFVDDDWIGAALDEGGVRRVVLAERHAPLAARAIWEDAVVLPYAAEGGLNGPAHREMNMAHQAQFLRAVRWRS